MDAENASEHNALARFDNFLEDGLRNHKYNLFKALERFPTISPQKGRAKPKLSSNCR